MDRVRHMHVQVGNRRARGVDGYLGLWDALDDQYPQLTEHSIETEIVNKLRVPNTDILCKSVSMIRRLYNA